MVLYLSDFISTIPVLNCTAVERERERDGPRERERERESHLTVNTVTRVLFI